VCLYKLGAGGANRWAMTERRAASIHREQHSFTIGPSQLEWHGDALHIEIDEWANPLPRRVAGRVVIHPQALSQYSAALDEAGRHRWAPIAPAARIEVDLFSPALRWQGTAYVDSNEGDEPIDKPFLRWDWLRTAEPDGGCRVVYDTQLRNGQRRTLGLHFNAHGEACAFEPLPAQALPISAWRVAGTVCSDAPPALVQRLEDTPFYARNLVRLSLQGQQREAVHETLDVNRLVHPLVQWMLPWRMPRWG
jgi:carotenoid 1,2-hydratase